MNRTKQKKLMAAKGIVAAIFILVMIVCIWVFVVNCGERKINELLNLGNKYLEDMDYESAVLVFDQAISIDPKCEEAYLGKAQAQYALGQYEDAIATLQEGIAKVDDSSRLEEFLQQILEMEMSEETMEETVSESVEIKNAVEKELLLNYMEIVRFTDTQEPEIQLEILGDEGNEGKYTWESSATECVDVSATGLVICKSVEGTAMVYAKDEYGNRSKECTIYIYSPDRGITESESEIIKIRDYIGNEEKEQDYALRIEKKEGIETATVDVLGKNIYYSGDVAIPETLQFKGREMAITGISSRAFRWSDEMESIFIPATIENMGIREHETSNPFYFCTNLKEIRVDENNSFLKVEDGVLYSKDGKILYSYPAGKEDSSFILPKEVEKVCSGAFLGCKNLEEILVEEGNEHYESGGGALIEKEWKRLVAYPIGNGLTSYIVPDGVKNLDDNVFYYSNLEEIDCGSLEGIYDSAFRQCNMLKKLRGGENTIYISWNSDQSVEFEGFNDMKNLSSLYIPWSGKQDINEFTALESLRQLHLKMDGGSLDLHVLGNLSGLSSLEIAILDEVDDLSWLDGLDSLHSLYLLTKEFNVTDLEPLYSLDNLQSIHIVSQSTDRKELSPNMIQQIEKLKEQRPELYVDIWE